MEVVLERLQEDDFYRLDIPVLFNDKATSRCFGLITNGKQSFGLAWQSTIVQPGLNKVNHDVFSIGIDQDFSVVDFDSNSILLQLNLFYNFIMIQLFKENIFIITELEILKVDKNTYKVVAEYGLPDLFEEVIVGKDSLHIKCAENKTIEIV